MTAPNPEGDVVLVPREPTEAMRKAGRDAAQSASAHSVGWEDEARSVFDAMIEAAPAALQPSPAVQFVQRPCPDCGVDEGVMHREDCPRLVALPPVSGGGVDAVAQDALLPTEGHGAAVVEPTEAEIRSAAAALAVEWYCHPGESEDSKGEAATQWKGFASMARVALIAARQQAPISAEGAAVGWRSIETAPRDGTKIDILYEGHRVPDAYWSGGQKRGKWCAPGWDYDGFDGVVTSGKDPAVTHWMPLPAAPDAISTDTQVGMSPPSGECALSSGNGGQDQ